MALTLEKVKRESLVRLTADNIRTFKGDKKNVFLFRNKSETAQVFALSLDGNGLIVKSNSSGETYEVSEVFVQA
jgi:hypothetical protein